MTREEKQKAIYALKISAPVMVVTQEKFNDYIHTLNKVMDWLEQEPCEDCIDREEAKQFLYERLDRLNNDELYDIFSKIVDDMYNELSSVTPQPKMGHWIEEFNDLEGEVRFTCSCCGKYQPFGTDYCYNCGAKMVEQQESEDNK